MRKISISTGNSKGLKDNFSITFGKGCRNCDSCLEHCYNIKAWKQYKEVRDAWTKNLKFAIENPEQIRTDINDYLKRKRIKVDFFRIHVSGDFITQEYLNVWIDIARDNKETTFFAFTKSYDLEFKEIPANMIIIFSAFEGMSKDEIKEIQKKSKRFPVSEAGDIKISGIKRRFKCHGNCTDCGFMCANLRQGESVHFDIH